MAEKRLMSAERMLSLVRSMAGIARRVAGKVAEEDGEQDAFCEGAASAMEQLVDVLEDPDNAEEAAAAEAAPDN